MSRTYYQLVIEDDRHPPLRTSYLPKDQAIRELTRWANWYGWPSDEVDIEQVTEYSTTGETT